MHPSTNLLLLLLLLPIASVTVIAPFCACIMRGTCARAEQTNNRRRCDTAEQAYISQS